MTVFGPAVESFGYALLAGPVTAGVLRSWTGTNALRRGLALASFCVFVAGVVSLWFPFGLAFNKLGVQAFAGMLFLGSVLVEWWEVTCLPAAAPDVAPILPARVVMPRPMKSNRRVHAVTRS